MKVEEDKRKVEEKESKKEWKVKGKEETETTIIMRKFVY
jgi:hypothetical protein